MTGLAMLHSTRADAASLYGLSLDDIADRLSVMREQESSPSYRPVDYLETVPQHLADDHRRSRKLMCAWCHGLADVCHLSRHASSRAMGYLDRFLASGHVRALRALQDKREYQLAAMTAFYTSVKMHEPLALEASLLAEISRGCYGAEEIIEMELCLLQALRWKVNGPTSREFACLSLGLLDPRACGYDLDVLGDLLDATAFQCELAAADHDLSVHCKPSVVALAALLNALDESPIPKSARHDFVRRMRGFVLLNDGADLADVAAAGLMLRRCLDENSGVSQTKESAEELRRSTNARDVGSEQTPCRDDGECSSPIAVAARRCSQY